MLRVFVFALFCVSLVVSDPSSDLITSLPGLSSTLSYKQFSGYLQASHGKQLHYWFVQVQNGNPADVPLLLWLNGGPGCSSLDGFLEEHGPLHVTEDGQKLYENPYAWNKIANVLYIEAPAGVGFSYSTQGNDYTTNDYQVAADNLLALQDFFSKFPELRANDFYVTGESYGGVYVPSLAQAIVQSNAAGLSKINLKGIAVGNGLSDYRLNDNSVIMFAYGHSLIGPDLWSDLTSGCCTGGQDPTRYECNFHNSTVPSCVRAVSEASVIIYNSGLNFYALYLNCTNTPSARRSRLHADMDNLFRAYREREDTAALFSHARTSLYQRLADELKTETSKVRVIVDSERSEKAFKHKLIFGDSPRHNVGEEVPCIDSYGPETWLNNPATRTALHISPRANRWSICSGEVGSNYQRNFTNMDSVYQYLIQNNVRALVYNGDTDMACNALGDEAFVSQLGRSLLKERRPWELGGQVAGFVTEYDMITFLSVKGAGHMVPQWRPPQALSMIYSFLYNKPY